MQGYAHEYTLEENGKTVKMEDVDKEKDLGIYVINDMKVARQCKKQLKSHECTENHQETLFQNR